MRLPSRVLCLFLAAFSIARCTTPGGSVRPAPPPSRVGRPISDPPPSRVVIHATLFREGLRRQLADSLPRGGSGDIEIIAGQQVHYSWQRAPLELKFDRGRILVTVPVTCRVRLFGEHEFPIVVSMAGEPVITADFKALLQSIELKVQAAGSVDRVNRGIEEKLQQLLTKTVEDFRFDVRPLMMETFARIAQPIAFTVGDQTACAELRIVALEAGPTVLADGVEKDLAVVILPSVTLPCTPLASLAQQPDGGPLPNTGHDPGADAGDAAADAGHGPVSDAGNSGDGGVSLPPGFALPLLANVATIPSGPFTVTIPIAAGYDELSKALAQAIHGRLYFSNDHPELYLEKPQVYPSDDTVVIRLLLGGKAKVGGGSIDMDGEIYLAGHPRVIDNQITVPDLEITPGTASELLKLKFAFDHDAIRDQARSALRVDLSERLAHAKDKLSTELTFSENLGCVRAEVLRSEVTGIYPHPSFLRIYTQMDAQASLYVPCKH